MHRNDRNSKSHRSSNKKKLNQLIRHQALATLVVNKLRGGLQVCAVKAGDIRAQPKSNFQVQQNPVSISCSSLFQYIFHYLVVSIPFMINSVFMLKQAAETLYWQWPLHVGVSQDNSCSIPDMHPIILL